jgi:translation initiation factor IF-3
VVIGNITDKELDGMVLMYAEAPEIVSKLLSYGVYLYKENQRTKKARSMIHLVPRLED